MTEHDAVSAAAALGLDPKKLARVDIGGRLMLMNTKDAAALFEVLGRPRLAVYSGWDSVSSSTLTCYTTRNYDQLEVSLHAFSVIDFGKMVLNEVKHDGD